MNKFVTTFAGIALLAAAVPVHGQMRTLEIGMDGGISYSDPATEGTDNRVWDVSVPFQSARVGLFVTPQISLEPAVTLNRVSLPNDERATQVTTVGNVLYHLNTPEWRPQLFAQAGGGLEYVSWKDVDFDENDTQWVAGAGVGMKLPVADRLALRTSAVYWRAFESDHFPRMNQVRGQVGVSFFTR